MKYNIKKEEYLDRCYWLADYLNGSEDIYSYVAEMGKLDINYDYNGYLEEMDYLISGLYGKDKTIGHILLLPEDY